VLYYGLKQNRRGGDRTEQERMVQYSTVRYAYVCDYECMALWGFALDAAERFFSSVIMRAHNFMKPKASPCIRFARYNIAVYG
jgi:hypothetical protein